MWIDEIAQHIDSLAIAGAPTPTFVQTIPADISVAVMAAAPPSGMALDPELPGLVRGYFQLVVRDRTSELAEDLAQRISDAIETEQSFELTKIAVNYIRPRHLPLPFPRSDGDYYEAVVNFDLCFYRLSA